MSKIALTYDDIQLIPSYSEVESRKNISLKTKLSTNFELDLPLVASPMDTVCEKDMAYQLWLMGGVGCIHRFMSIEEQCKEVERLRYSMMITSSRQYSEKHTPIMAAVGSNGDYLERSKELIKVGVNVIVIDVAHGHHLNVKNAISSIKEIANTLGVTVDVIAGNIATAQAAIDLQDWGADGLRVGIGGGCFTPNMLVKTTNGLQSIKDIKIGDIVYTHTGKEQPVINKMTFERDEEIISINNIDCTKNHEFYVVNKKYQSLIHSDEDIHKYGEWIPAGNLNKNYLLVEL